MNFKLTLRKPYNDSRFDILIWDHLLYDIMKLLYTKFDLKDEPDLCDVSLAEYLTEKELRNLTIFITGRDWQSQVKVVGDLVLIGDRAGKSDDFCFECGHPKIQLVGYYITCNHCGFSRLDDSIDYDNGDINDFSGRINLNKLY